MKHLHHQLDDVISEAASYVEKIGADASWVAYANSGVLGLTMPASLGGRGLDLSSLVAMFEGLGYGGGDAGMLFALGAQLLSVQYPILKFGTEEQRQLFLPRMISGELRAAYAATEPNAGSDIFSLTTSAVPCPNGYRITGTKRFITSAPIADVALVLARTRSGGGMWGITAFVVDLHDERVCRSGNASKLGLQAAELGEIRFDDCYVPIGRRLGREGSGASVFNVALDFERAFILSPVLGVMRRQLEQTVSEANRRQQHGHSIGAFQAVSNRIADMATRLEVCRLLIYHAAAVKEVGRSSKQCSAAVKLVVSEHFLSSSLDAMRIASTSGYLLTDPAQANLRDAIGSLFYSGTSDVLRNIIANQAGVNDA